MSWQTTLYWARRCTLAGFIQGVVRAARASSVTRLHKMLSTLEARAPRAGDETIQISPAQAAHFLQNPDVTPQSTIINLVMSPSTVSY